MLEEERHLQARQRARTPARPCSARLRCTCSASRPSPADLGCTAALGCCAGLLHWAAALGCCTGLQRAIPPAAWRTWTFNTLEATSRPRAARMRRLNSGLSAPHHAQLAGCEGAGTDSQGRTPRPDRRLGRCDSRGGVPMPLACPPQRPHAWPLPHGSPKVRDDFTHNNCCRHGRPTSRPEVGGERVQDFSVRHRLRCQLVLGHCRRPAARVRCLRWLLAAAIVRAAQGGAVRRPAGGGGAACLCGRAALLGHQAAQGAGTGPPLAVRAGLACRAASKAGSHSTARADSLCRGAAAGERAGGAGPGCWGRAERRLRRAIAAHA